MDLHAPFGDQPELRRSHERSLRPEYNRAGHAEPHGDSGAQQRENTRRRKACPPWAPADQATLRSRIRNERRVELAFEGHRYWDVRRWMIAGQAIGGTITGVNITRNADGSFTYQPATVETRVWNDKLYFYPIPQSEITVSTT